MIPYADLERAIARWKLRQAGGEVAPPPAEAGSIPEAEAEPARQSVSSIMPIVEFDDGT